MARKLIILIVFVQAKEKLINALQHNEGSVGVAGDARLEEVRLEKEHLQAQLTNTLTQLERVRKDMQVHAVLQVATGQSKLLDILCG